MFASQVGRICVVGDRDFRCGSAKIASPATLYALRGGFASPFRQKTRTGDVNPPNLRHTPYLLLVSYTHGAQVSVTREPARNTRRAGPCVYGNKAPQPLEYEEGLLRTGIFREPWGLPENACRCLPEWGRSTWPVIIMAFSCPGRSGARARAKIRRNLSPPRAG